MLINDTAIALIETKTSLHVDDIKEFFSKTLPNFKKFHTKLWNNKEIINIFACKNFYKERQLEIKKELKTHNERNFVLEMNYYKTFDIIYNSK